MSKIAFIGLGNMGSGMAANLVKSGHGVRVYDLNVDAVRQLEDQGAQASPSVAAAIIDAEFIVTMLPAGPHVRDVYTGAGGVFDHAQSSALLIDCSTIDVDTARDLSDIARRKGFACVDAPVSGGVAAAQGGSLTFMVGGEDAAFKAAEPILGAMGKAVIHAGGSGAGQAAKICNNMLLAIHMIGTCEAMNLALKLDLDPQRFFDIASQASGQNWSLTSYCPVPGPVPNAPSNRDYQPGFATPMMLKDLKLATSTASSAGAAVPLGAHAESLYEIFNSNGGENLDFSAIIKMISGEMAS